MNMSEKAKILNQSRPYQQCTRCVMDTSAAKISFDKSGICDYCTEFLARSGHILFEDATLKEVRLQRLVQKVKASGAGKPYDCIIGVSGGVDSSWTLVEAKRLGLRPLAVHMDNGWNSELAQNNISNLIQALGVDLFTYVIDWEEYRSLMQAFFDADVIDVELLYDNAMLAVNYQQANKYGLKYILAGTNQSTEGMRMPVEWYSFKYDKRQIEALARLSGMRGIESFPAISTYGFIWNHFLKGKRWIPFLDYLLFNKFTALDHLEKHYGYKRYPFKHYESVFTRFFQGYILPKKFSVDKRKLHFATLVASGLTTREQALEGLKGAPYHSQSDMDADIDYFLKKMRWTPEDLQNYINRPGKPHSIYPTEEPVWQFLLKVYKRLKKHRSA